MKYNQVETSGSSLMEYIINCLGKTMVPKSSTHWDRYEKIHGSQWELTSLSTPTQPRQIFWKGPYNVWQPSIFLTAQRCYFSSHYKPKHQSNYLVNLGDKVWATKNRQMFTTNKWNRTQVKSGLYLGLHSFFNSPNGNHMQILAVWQWYMLPWQSHASKCHLSQY